MSKSILLIDDEKLSTKYLHKELAIYCTVETANTSEEALLILATKNVNIVISDYLLSGTNGLDLIEHIYTNYPDIRRFIMTGLEEDIFTEVLETGLIERVFTKPIDIDLVLNELGLT